MDEEDLSRLPDKFEQVRHFSAELVARLVEQACDQARAGVSYGRRKDGAEPT
jgi:hypothetical protein